MVVPSWQAFLSVAAAACGMGQAALGGGLCLPRCRFALGWLAVAAHWQDDAWGKFATGRKREWNWSTDCTGWIDRLVDAAKEAWVGILWSLRVSGQMNLIRPNSPPVGLRPTPPPYAR